MRRFGTWLVSLLFLASGALHLLNPPAFYWLMPPWLPLTTELILLSGVAELAAAIGLVFKMRWAPKFAALVLLGVWPANWWFAIDVLGRDDFWLAVAAWVRLPLQVPLVLWAYRSEVRGGK